MFSKRIYANPPSSFRPDNPRPQVSPWAYDGQSDLWVWTSASTTALDRGISVTFEPSHDRISLVEFRRRFPGRNPTP